MSTILRTMTFAALTVLALTPAAGAVECITNSSSGQTACGYHCVSSGSEARCAQTADGVCASTSGILVCWDPPPVLRRVYATGHLPAASCVTSNGQTACGYACVAQYDQVQCAQTPFGACRANMGRLVCWDPPAEVMLARRERTPAAGCITGMDRVACGYHCEMGFGRLQCAQTPDGLCRAERDQLYCWDPPLESAGSAYDPVTERACLASSSGRACGFRCLATTSAAGCGDDRRDVCRYDGETGRVACAAP